LALHPTHAGALSKLAARAREERAFADLAFALERLAEIAGSAAPAGELGLPRAAALHVEIAELYRERLGDPARAQLHLERARAHDPCDRAAREAVERSARERGDSGAVDLLLGRRVELEEDPARRARMQIERAQVRLSAGDAAGARALFAGVGDAAPDPALAPRAPLDPQRGDPPGAAAALSEVARRARALGDTSAEADALRKLAPLLEGALARAADAERAWARLGELDPSDLTAAEALVRLSAAARSPAERTVALERLREALRRSFAPPAREAAVVRELAEILSAQGRTADALARLSEAATPADSADAWRELATRASAAGDLVLSAQAWAQLAARSAEPIARGEAWLALADLATRLHDPARAPPPLPPSLPPLPPSPLPGPGLAPPAAA